MRYEHLTCHFRCQNCGAYHVDAPIWDELAEPFRLAMHESTEHRAQPVCDFPYGFVFLGDGALSTEQFKARYAAPGWRYDLPCVRDDPKIVARVEAFRLQSIEFEKREQF